MKKKSVARALPTFEKFRTDFLRLLGDHYAAEPLIMNVLKDKVISEHCAALLWMCVNNSSTHLAKISKKWFDYWNSKLQIAVRGAEAAADIYANLANKPEQVESMHTLRNDLLERRRRLTALPSKKRGQKQDWTVVLHAKEQMQSLVGTPLPDSTLAALLSAACVASGQEKKEFKANAVRMALTRLRDRLS